MSRRLTTSCDHMTEQTSDGKPARTPELHGLIMSLIELNPQAIKQLGEQLDSAIKSIKGIYLLRKEDIEELKQDALLITIKRLQDGQVLYDGTTPVAFARGVALKLLQNRIKKRKLDTVELIDHDQTMDFNAEQYMMHKETELKIGQLLKQLGGVCEKIIRLKYFEELRDQEVIAQQLVGFSNVDSLKSKRCACLRRVAELAKEQGISLKSEYFRH